MIGFFRSIPVNKASNFRNEQNTNVFNGVVAQRYPFSHFTNRDESCLRYCIVAPHSTRISRAKTISTVQVSNLLKSGWFIHSSDLNLTLMYYSIDEPYFRLCIVFLESCKHIHIWTWHYKCMSVTITTIKSSSRICHAILVLCFSCLCSFLCYYSVGDFFHTQYSTMETLVDSSTYTVCCRFAAVDYTRSLFSHPFLDIFTWMMNKKTKDNISCQQTLNLAHIWEYPRNNLNWIRMWKFNVSKLNKIELCECVRAYANRVCWVCLSYCLCYLAHCDIFKWEFPSENRNKHLNIEREREKYAREYFGWLEARTFYTRFKIIRVLRWSSWEVLRFRLSSQLFLCISFSASLSVVQNDCIQEANLI